MAYGKTKCSKCEHLVSDNGRTIMCYLMSQPILKADAAYACPKDRRGYYAPWETELKNNVRFNSDSRY